MSSYQYKNSHYKDKMVPTPSHLYNENSYTGNTLYLYWIGSLFPCVICVVFFVCLEERGHGGILSSLVEFLQTLCAILLSRIIYQWIFMFHFLPNDWVQKGSRLWIWNPYPYIELICPYDMVSCCFMMRTFHENLGYPHYGLETPYRWVSARKM